jgi:hypothetical protein
MIEWNEVLKKYHTLLARHEGWKTKGNDPKEEDAESTFND